MKRATIVLFLMIVPTLLGSCGNTESDGLPSRQVIDCTKAKTVEMKDQLVLELDWGSGEDQVGYMDQRFGKFNETWQGPCDICVDDRGEIYIDDSMNLRILKYGSDGKLIAAIPKETLTDKLEPRALSIACTSEDLILYTDGASVIKRFNVEKNELTELDLNLAQDVAAISIVEVITDDNDNVHVVSKASSDAENHLMVLKLDSQLKSVLEIKELPDQVDDIACIDSLGSLYYLSKPGLDDDMYCINKIDNEGVVHELLYLKCEEGSRLYLREVNDDGFLLLKSKTQSSNIQNDEKILIIKNFKPLYYEIPIPIPARVETRVKGAVYFDSIPFLAEWEMGNANPYRVYKSSL